MIKMAQYHSSTHRHSRCSATTLSPTMSKRLLPTTVHHNSRLTNSKDSHQSKPYKCSKCSINSRSKTVEIEMEMTMTGRRSNQHSFGRIKKKTKVVMMIAKTRTICLAWSMSSWPSRKNSKTCSNSSTRSNKELSLS